MGSTHLHPAPPFTATSVEKAKILLFSPTALKKRPQKMSEVSRAKRKEKCENCTKQVSLRCSLEGGGVSVIPDCRLSTVQQETS